MATDKKSVSFTVIDDDATVGLAGTYHLVLDNDLTTNTIVPSDFEVSVSYDADNTSSTNSKLASLTDADAGEWVFDATIINVPYFPVGFEGTDTSVHFANESGASADVIVTAIDSEGETYGPVNLGEDLAKKSVTKVSQTKIMSLLGLTDATKLSVTFNIDADNGDVNAYAYTQKATQGRTEISTSQQHGVK